VLIAARLESLYAGCRLKTIMETGDEHPLLELWVVRGLLALFFITCPVQVVVGMAFN